MLLERNGFLSFVRERSVFFGQVEKPASFRGKYLIQQLGSGSDVSKVIHALLNIFLIEYIFSFKIPRFTGQ